MHGPRDQESDFKLPTGRAPTGGSRGDLPCLVQLLVAPGAPWLVAASLQPLLFSSHRLLVCMPVWLFLSLRKGLSLDSGPAIIQCDIISTFTFGTSAKTLFPSKVTF